MAIELRWGSATSAGKVRAANQDALIAGPDVFAVADGMGGHAAGEVASGLTVAALAEAADIDRPLELSDVLGAIDSANTAIVDAARRHPERAGMGTTLAGVAAVRSDDGDALLAFNVGDSRVYRLNGTGIEQISTDHSVVSELVQTGQLTAEAARSDPRRNVITRALGTEGGVAPDVWFLTPAPGDRFLLCSDGLTDEVPDDDLVVLLAEGDPQASADSLVAAALERGARDNVSAIVVEVTGVDDADVGARRETTNPRGLGLAGAAPPRPAPPAAPTGAVPDETPPEPADPAAPAVAVAAVDGAPPAVITGVPEHLRPAEDER